MYIVKFMTSPTRESSRQMIDVREFPEFAVGHIPGAIHIPLASISGASTRWPTTQALILVCRSGARSTTAHQLLARKGFTNLDILPGGIEAWSASGGTLIRLPRRPWSLERQVRIGAGSLILITLILNLLVSHWFVIGTAIVGVGLTFAGITDICMMATALARFPWNRSAQHS